MYMYIYIYILKFELKMTIALDYNSVSSISVSKTCMHVHYTSLNPHPKVTALVHLARSLIFRLLVGI